MFFLTYHRVGEPVAGKDNFYTVSARGLEDHLDCLQARGLRCGKVEQLVAGESARSEFFLSFDDATRDHVDVVGPLLEGRGLRGIFFVPTEKLNRPGRLTGEEVRALDAAGHEIGCHSHEHRRMDTQSDAEMRGQLATSCGILADLLGRRPRIFAPPGGYTSKALREAAREAGLRVIRTMKWGLNVRSPLDDLETIPLNRGVGARELRKILDGRGLRWLRTVYFGKQMVKRVLPTKFYERARTALSRG